MMRTLAVLLLAASLTACSGTDEPIPLDDVTPQGRTEPGDATPAPATPAPVTTDPVDPDLADPQTDQEPTANPALLDASLATDEAPATYTVKFETTKGDMLIDVTRSWAPNGADRFYNLVSIGYFDDIALFRVIPGFMAQLGIHGDPAIASIWSKARIDDDPVTQSNTTGMVTFATAGPNTRTTQVFLNLSNNTNLDGMGFAPFGKLRDMTVLNQIYSGYGEGAPRGNGPHQGRLQAQGNAYLKADFPNLDYIVKATIVQD